MHTVQFDLFISVFSVAADLNGVSVPAIIEQLLARDQSAELQLWVAKWYQSLLNS